MAAGQFGVSVETPQDVLARIQQMRTQQVGSGNPLMIQEGILGRSLDSIFGNPEVKAAKAKTDALTAAASSVQGTDIDSTLTRLQTMRDAVAKLDPNAASQLNMQILQLGEEKLQRQKLLGDISRADNEEARKAQSAPFDLAKTQAETALKLNEGQNYWKPQNGKIQRINVDALDSLERRRLRSDGWAEGNGPTTEAEATSALGLTKPIQTDLQTAIIGAQNKMSALSSQMQKYDPKFLTYLEQGKQVALGAWEKMGGQLSPAEAANRKQFTEFRANASDFLNQYIHEITGAAVGVKEEGRIRSAIPDPYKNSSKEFEANVRNSVRNILGVERRAQQLLKADPNATWTRQALDNIPLPTVPDSEVDKFMADKFGWGAKDAPKTSSNGWSIKRDQ